MSTISPLADLKSNIDLYALTGLTRMKFYNFCNRSVPWPIRTVKLTQDATALLVLKKLHQNPSYTDVTALPKAKQVLSSGG